MQAITPRFGGEYYFRVNDHQAMSVMFELEDMVAKQLPQLEKKPTITYENTPEGKKTPRKHFFKVNTHTPSTRHDFLTHDYRILQVVAEKLDINCPRVNTPSDMKNWPQIIEGQSTLAQAALERMLRQVLLRSYNFGAPRPNELNKQQRTLDASF